MATSLLITLREGLEAALIVGIVLGILRQLQLSEGRKPVWLGVMTAVLVSITTGVVLTAFGLGLEGSTEQIFEGVTMLIAAGVLTWMIFWMQGHAPNLKQNLERGIRESLEGQQNTSFALFTLAFFAVVREGVETALFLTAATYSTTARSTLIGGGIGLIGAILIGWLIFIAGKRLNIKLFFQVTSVLLLIVAAGLVAHGVHELQEAALLPMAIEHVWDINHILDENSVLGQFMKAMFGYNGNPSLIEVIAYAVYMGIVGWFVWVIGKQLHKAQLHQSTGNSNA